jgi:hypothetical protein
MQPSSIAPIEVASAGLAQPSTPALPQSDANIKVRLDGDEGAYGAFLPPTRARFEPTTMSAADSYAPFIYAEEERPIPWKLIAAGVVLILVTYAAVQGLTRSAAAPVIATVKKVVPTPKPAPEPAADDVPETAIGGQIVVNAQPPGLKVLIDGKAAGETPLTVNNVTAGRHVVTLLGEGGSVKRTVRVDKNRGVTIELPMFSGFAKISAPFVIQVAENGKRIGSTDDEQIILGPGSHRLHFSNSDLNYDADQTVEVQPGDTTRITLDPRGRANINAAPWAEIWIDGEKAGETPMANVPIRLGLREIILKNPQFPDRKITTTIKSGEVQTFSVDFNKDK